MDAEYLSLPPFNYLPRTWRSEGTHLSDIRSWLAIKLGYQEQDADFTGWELAGSIGFLFEDCISGVLADIMELGLLKGVELKQDGIYMSPDGLHPETGEPWDFKFTWKSIGKTPPEENWSWGVQLAGYARTVGSKSAVVVALYCCGDYKPPQPRLVAVRITWTQEELDRNWLMLVNGKQAMETERLGSKQ